MGQPEVHFEYVVVAMSAQSFVDRRTERHIEEHGGHLATGSLVVQDLGQLAHQHIAIARVFAGDPGQFAEADKTWGEARGAALRITDPGS
jgi:hypothetical protein